MVGKRGCERLVIFCMAGEILSAKNQVISVLSTDPLRASNSKRLVDRKEFMSFPVDDSLRSSRARSTGLNFWQFQYSVMCGSATMTGLTSGDVHDSHSS